MDVLKAGKRTIALNLKKEQSISLVRKMVKVSDVLIDPYRFGVLEKLGLGPDVLMKDNPRLIYTRLTGFGNSGIYAKLAGHDINYIAVSGLLSMLGRKNEKPTAPINFAADFAGGGLLAALGVCIALLERHNSGKGQIVDSAMVEGAAYVSSWLTRSQNLPIWGNDRGQNTLDTGAHFYDTYETKDGKFMSVGAIEPQFYEKLLKGLNLEDVNHYGDYEKGKEKFATVFKTKTQHEWCEIFDGEDACVLPVLSFPEAAKHPHNVSRDVFVDAKKTDGLIIPNPAPKLSRTPGQSSFLKAGKTQADQILDILQEIGLKRSEIRELYEEGSLLVDDKSKL